MHSAPATKDERIYHNQIALGPDGVQTGPFWAPIGYCESYRVRTIWSLMQFDVSTTLTLQIEDTRLRKS